VDTTSGCANLLYPYDVNGRPYNMQALTCCCETCNTNAHYCYISTLCGSLISQPIAMKFGTLRCRLRRLIKFDINRSQDWGLASSQMLRIYPWLEKSSLTQPCTAEQYAVNIVVRRWLPCVVWLTTGNSASSRCSSPPIERLPPRSRTTIRRRRVSIATHLLPFVVRASVLRLNLMLLRVNL